MIDVRVAQIGCGHWGKNLARNFAQIGSLAAVADNNEEMAARAASAHNVPKRTFEEVLQDPDIHGVAIATPAILHAQMTMQALEAGKHVYVEKPIALDTSDAATAISFAKKRGLSLMVGHLLQYHPTFIALKNLVHLGKFGALRYVYSNRMSLGKIRTEENVMWSFAPHDFSMILGLVDEEPEIVTAQGACIVNPDIEDWSTVQLVFRSGVKAHVQTSWLHPFKEQRLVVIGSEGMAVFEDSRAEWGERLAIYPHIIDKSGPTPIPNQGPVEYVAVPYSEPLRNECEHFLSCIANSHSPRTDGSEGLRVLQVLDRAQAALDSRKGLSI
jgi:predicted dehydrogenase